MSSRSHLQELLNQGGHRFIVVSNREPFMHERYDGRVVWTQPAGGLTAALDPLLRWSRGIWVAHGSGGADRETADRNSRVSVPPDAPAYTLKRVWIPEEVRRGSYNGLSNRGLWPLCHNVYQRPRFSDADWHSYRTANQLFCDSVLQEAGDDAATIFIQDYHLALLPRMLRRRNDRLAIAHFWHIPWPAPEVFSIFPWKDELLDGLLGSDLLGFHLNDDATNFLCTVERSSRAEVESRRGQVRQSGRLTAVRQFPIGIDFERHCALSRSRSVRGAIESWRQRLGTGVTVGVGIDRVDYTKGIPERLRALDLLLERQPEWRGRLVFVQVGAPSRGEIPEYDALAKEIQQRVQSINSRWGSAAWQPVRYIAECLSAEDMIALHRLAAFCLVTPLHDGMNLVAKEFVASRDDLDGVLILSRFAGAAAELDSAVRVNPFSEDDIARGVSTALALSPTDRKMRMSRMRAAVAANTTYHWADGILSELMTIRRDNRDQSFAPELIDRAASAAEVAFS